MYYTGTQIVNKLKESRLCIMGPNDVIKMIDELDPQDVRPNIRARWIDSHCTSFYLCSNCGVFWDKASVNTCNMLYCPRCGASMTGNKN